MKPSYEDLERELHHTKSELDQTKDLLRKALEEISRLTEEVNKLKEQIGRNSQNSSKSPSSDQKGNTGDQPKKKRKKRRGVARAVFPSARIDCHVVCSQENCPHCGSTTIELNGQSPEIVQQAELPEIKATVTEYQLLKYSCGCCGRNSVASLPLGVPDSAFGPKLMGLLVTLTGVFHLAKREAVQLIKELYDVDMSIGTVSNIEERVSKALDPIYQRIHSFVIESKFCKHFDETSWRDRGKRHYVWLASCEQAALYKIDRHRSSEAFLKLFTGNPDEVAVVTDRYAVYSIFKRQQYCLAHLIREFHGYAEKKGLDKEIGKALENEMKIACHIHKEYREGKISLAERNWRISYRKRKLKDHLEDGMANGSDDLSKLSETLLDNFDKLWTFTKTLGMEPTNNLAERDLRKLVIWRKKSYGTRSDRGQKFVERITTVAQTLKRQKSGILNFIQQTIVGCYNKIEPPFIFKSLGF